MLIKSERQSHVTESILILVRVAMFERSNDYLLRMLLTEWGEKNNERIIYPLFVP